ncbi:MAG: VCBS repeat-containing protein [Planctomycetes bacterium]|nr:VCBS repeat-containing protein [Planctomycetota bacterium]
MGIQVRPRRGAGSTALVSLLLLTSVHAQGPAFDGALIPTALTPTSIALGDLDGDTFLDAAVTCQDGDASHFNGTVSVLIGAGGGGFAPAHNLALGIGAFPQHGALSDLNGDGKLDITISAYFLQKIDAALGDGAGGFGAPSSGTMAGGPHHHVVADLNLDGKLDVVAVSQTGITTLRGNGAGGFLAPVNLIIPGASQLSRLAAGDRTGDGVPDLVVLDTFGNAFWTLNGNGFGGFVSPLKKPCPSDPRGLVLAEFTGDGRLDLCIACGVGQTIALAAGTPGGGFAAVIPTAVSGSPADVAAGDLDQDGILDITVPQSAAKTLRRLLGTGSGGFVTFEEAWPVGLNPTHCAIADLDSDGRLDQLVTNRDGASLSFLRYGPQAAPAMTAFAGLKAAAFFDMNGDNRSDAIAANDTEIKISLTDSLGALTPFATGMQVTGSRALAVGDLSGDGIADAAIALGGFPASLSIAFGTGTGAIQFASTQPTQVNPGHAALGDIDADGFTDVLLWCAGTVQDQGRLVIHRGLGAGALAPFTETVSLKLALGMAVGDVDGDGRTDALVASENGGGAMVHYAGINSDFSQVHGENLAGARGVTSADFDRDGRRDFAVAGINATAVFRQGAAGAFSRFDASLYGDLGTAALACDADADGAAEIVTPLFAARTLAVVTGTDGPTPSVTYSLAIPQNPSAPAGLTLSGSLLGDGRVDWMHIPATKSSLILYRSTASPPIGMQPYGQGSAGCAGVHLLTPDGPAELGSTTYRFLTSHAPSSSLGLCLVGDQPLVPAADPFFLGAWLNIDLFNSSFVLGLDTPTTSLGEAVTPLPIPPDSALAGNSYFAQTLFAWAPGACTPGLLISTSNGLWFILQP